MLWHYKSLVQILVTTRGAQWLALARRTATVQSGQQLTLCLRNIFPFHPHSIAHSSTCDCKMKQQINLSLHQAGKALPSLLLCEPRLPHTLQCHVIMQTPAWTPCLKKKHTNHTEWKTKLTHIQTCIHSPAWKTEQGNYQTAAPACWLLWNKKQGRGKEKQSVFQDVPPPIS